MHIHRALRLLVTCGCPCGCTAVAAHVVTADCAARSPPRTVLPRCVTFSRFPHYHTRFTRFYRIQLCTHYTTTAGYCAYVRSRTFCAHYGSHCAVWFARIALTARGSGFCGYHTTISRITTRTALLPVDPFTILHTPAPLPHARCYRFAFTVWLDYRTALQRTRLPLYTHSHGCHYGVPFVCTTATRAVHLRRTPLHCHILHSFCRCVCRTLPRFLWFAACVRLRLRRGCGYRYGSRSHRYRVYVITRRLRADAFYRTPRSATTRFTHYTHYLRTRGRTATRCGHAVTGLPLPRSSRFVTTHLPGYHHHVWLPLPFFV